MGIMLFLCPRWGFRCGPFHFPGEWNGSPPEGPHVPGFGRTPVRPERSIKGVRRLKYINAKEVLPEHLLTQLQEYVQGKMIYIPGRDAERAAWGEANGTRAQYLRRNVEIIVLYRKGLRVDDLADQYHLFRIEPRHLGHQLIGSLELGDQSSQLIALAFKVLNIKQQGGVFTPKGPRLTLKPGLFFAQIQILFNHALIHGRIDARGHRRGLGQCTAGNREHPEQNLNSGSRGSRSVLY